MNKPLYLFVGKSASGKTSSAEIIEKQFGLKSLQSYTTRKKRYDDETGHTFITDVEFDELKNVIAYTEYSGHKYCCTKEQIDNADIYVIDVPGVKTLLEKYDNNRPIIIFYFDTSVRTRIDRMLHRGDCDAAIISRLYDDEEYDWLDALIELDDEYEMVQGRNVQLYPINANKEQANVIKQILCIIEEIN